MSNVTFGLFQMTDVFLRSLMSDNTHNTVCEFLCELNILPVSIFLSSQYQPGKTS